MSDTSPDLADSCLAVRNSRVDDRLNTGIDDLSDVDASR
jgi:hypothetical protein